MVIFSKRALLLYEFGTVEVPGVVRRRMQLEGSVRLALAAALGAVLVACGSAEQAVDGCTGLQGDPPPESPPFPSWDEHAVDRAPANCLFGKGDLTETSIGADAPRPPPDFSVLVLMLENRSFDHYLNGVPGTDFARDRSNPDPNPANAASVVHQYRETGFCVKDTSHEWGASHLQFDNGLMDGFVATSTTSMASGCRAMGYYTKDDLPFIHWVAENFAVSDRHFGSLLGPTWPNRLFLFSGTSCGYTEGFDSNPGITLDCGLKEPSLFTMMRDRNIPFKVYDASGVASVSVGLGAVRSSAGPLLVPDTIEQFESDAANDSLPRFAMVGASTGQLVHWNLPGNPQNDDHPPSDVRLGQIFVYRIIYALMRNRETFRKTILFITYDEHGGLYDHVVPPAACEPYEPDRRTDYKFDRYGFRVPLLIVSPYVTELGYVSRYITDHTSITRFVEHWLELPALTKRDANAWPFLDVFDFDQPPIQVTLPPAPVDPSTCPTTPACQMSVAP